MNKPLLDPLGNYCCYLRKSREDIRAEQAGEYDTLERHRKTLTELAARYGVSLTAFYEEVVSGESIDARPQMKALLQAVDSGQWDGVFVMEIERLARGDTIDQGIVARSFKYSDTTIITPMKIYHPSDTFDEEYLEFSLYMSRKEYKTITRRMQAGRLRSVMDGKYVANRPPYGYRIVPLPDRSGNTLEIIPDQADVVRLVYQKCIDGMGMQAIADMLNGSGVPSQAGTGWSAASIRAILSNPVYYGYLRWGHRKVEKKVTDGQIIRMRPVSHVDTIYKGLHQPIISRETYDSARSLISTRRSIPQPKNRSLHNPFAGVLCCSKCGKLLTRRPYTDDRKRTTMVCTTKGCPTVGDFLDNIEREFLDSMQKICNHYKFEYEPDESEKEFLGMKLKAIENYKKKLGELNAQKDKLYDFLETGLYSEEIFRMRMGKLNTSVNETAQQLEKALEEYSSLTSTAALREGFVPKCEYLLDHYGSLTAEDRNRLIRELVTRIDYTKEQKNKRGHSHEINFTLDIYPRIPL